AEHDVRVLFTAPTAFRAIRQQDPDGKLIAKYDLARFRPLFLAGERADPPTVQWAEEKLRVPVIDHWWQTETGWPIGANCLGIEQLPVKHGSRTRAAPRRGAGGGERQPRGADRVGRAGAEGRSGRRGEGDAAGRDRRPLDQAAAAAGGAADPMA